MDQMCIPQGRALYMYYSKINTLEECIKTIKKEPHAINYIRDEFKTLEAWSTAITKDAKYVSEYPHNKEQFAKVNGLILKFIDVHNVCYKTIMEALYQNYMAIKYIPEDMQTIDMIKYVLRKDISMLKYINPQVLKPFINLE